MVRMPADMAASLFRRFHWSCQEMHTRKFPLPYTTTKNLKYSIRVAYTVSAPFISCYLNHNLGALFPCYLETWTYHKSDLPREAFSPVTLKPSRKDKPLKVARWKKKFIFTTRHFCKVHWNVLRDMPGDPRIHPLEKVWEHFFFLYSGQWFS